MLDCDVNPMERKVVLVVNGGGTSFSSRSSVSCACMRSATLPFVVACSGDWRC